MFGPSFMTRQWSIKRVTKMKKSLFLLLLTLFSGSVFAQSAPTQGVLDSILSNFVSASVGQMGVSQGFAKGIFFTLATFDITLFAIRKVLASGDLSDWIGGLTLKIFTYGFFSTLIIMGPTWIPLITQSFMAMGIKIAGGSALITPSGVMDLAAHSAASIWSAFTSSSSGLSIGSDILLGLAVICGIVFTIIGFMLIAIELLMTQIELTMVSSVGFFMLGFSGASFTTMFSEKYFGYIVSSGVKLVVVCAIAGYGTNMSQNFIDVMTSFNGQSIPPVAMLVATTPMLIYGILAMKLPAIAGAVMSGSPSMSVGSLAGGAAAIAGGIAGAGLAGAGLAAGAAGAGGTVGDFARQSLDKLSVLAGGGGDVRSTMGDNFDRLASLSSGSASSGALDSIGNPNASSGGGNSPSKAKDMMSDGVNRMGGANSQLSQSEGGGAGVSIRFNHLGD